MFFKRLEVVGFKSFATKTVIEFLPGVTVIVGPNGCGKSNVLDSIKWVLGSQSVKSMRGKSMQDVIFAGSTSFKPLGVAQVTLTLDNSSRVLDIDYDEVQISRRLFRTGESEYFLNKTPCRLRDIQDLLRGTGAGTMSYSVLEQGKVDQIINAKPEERRFIIEEAAGISKFKSRKLEALRKLERTAADLQRLDDLVSEITRQVNSLKRQASKAERFKELSDELRRSEMELLVLRSAGIRQQLEDLVTQIAAQQDKITETQARHAQRSAQEQEWKNQAGEADVRLTEAQTELFKTNNRIKDLEHQCNRCNDRIEGNKRRLAQIEAEFAQFNERGAEMAARRSEIEQRKQQAEGELQSARANFEELEGKYTALRGEVDGKSRELDTINREVNQTREQLSRTENTLRIEETLIARQEETRTETEGIIEKLTRTLGEFGTRRESATAKLETLKQQIGEAQRNSSGLQIKFAETHSRIAGLTSKRDDVNRDLHQSQARLATLSELKANFEGFFHGVREVMKAAGRGELAGVTGPVVSLIKTGKECELALEVALASQLQDIVVESAEAARNCTEFLTKGKLGRVTFLPLDRMAAQSAPENLNEILSRDGVVGHAPALAEHESNLDGIVSALLGRTVIVREFETADKLAAEFPGVTFVALTGQMIHATGSITGGVLKSSGLLGRERDIADLTEAVARYGVELEQTQSLIAIERADADRLQADLKSSTGMLHELEVQKATAMKEEESLRRQHEETAQHLEQREQQLDGLKTEIQSRQEARARHESERTELAAKLETATKNAEDSRAQTRELNEAFIALGQNVSDARAGVEKVRERMVHLDESLNGIVREIATLESARESRAAEQGRLQEDNARAAAETEEFRKELQDRFADREKMEKALAEERTERQKLDSGMRELAHEIEQMQRDERMLENDLHEKQLRQAEWQSKLGNMSEQSMEKFGRDLTEIAAEVGEITKEIPVLSQEVAELRDKVERMGPVNMAALDEYNEQNTRLQFLTGQRTDLVDSKAQIEASIAQLDETTKRLFHETFESVRGHFVNMFRRLFNGGKADLVIEQTGLDPLLEGGIEIYAQPPGKKLQTLSLMSGGEKAMTAVSLLFALFLHKPAPFAILDEIDAPLDDANVERFKNVVAEFSNNTQFVIISHNKLTMEMADAIYGVTMEESGVSRIVSVQFEQIEVQPVGSAG